MVVGIKVLARCDPHATHFEGVVLDGLGFVPKLAQLDCQCANCSIHGLPPASGDRREAEPKMQLRRLDLDDDLPILVAGDRSCMAQG